MYVTLLFRLKPTGIIVIPVFLVLLSACDHPQNSDLMREELAAIYQHALEDPMPYFHMNSARAEWMREKAQNLPQEKIMLHRFYLSKELLNAGQSEAAISELSSLLADLGASPDNINDTIRPIIDELALAYLRLGEQINCIEGHNGESCIMPIGGTGIQTWQEGSKQAIELYKTILRKYPDDFGSRWLLNVACMSIGSYPDSVPEPYLIKGLKASSSGSFPRFSNIAPDLGVAVNELSGGVSVEDFNRDGHLDLFMTSYGLNDPAHLFLADGSGGYEDHTAEAGLNGIVSGLNTVDADYDNDGYTDIFVLRGAWLADAGGHPNSLLHNNGDGTFTDVTHTSGLLSYHPTQTASWADFNLDGYLDLFIGNESNTMWQDVIAKNRTGQGISHSSELYLNNGDGTFTEVSEKVGIHLKTFVKGVVWGDINNDGLPDLFASVNGENNRLYVNKGGTSIEDWHFEDQAAEAGVNMPIFSFPAWFWDFNNDGWQDLLVLSYDFSQFTQLEDEVAREYMGLHFKSELSRLYLNNRDGTFSDVTMEAQLGDKVLYSMGSNFGDLDNDGWLDFYVGTGAPDLHTVVPNRMFHNIGGRQFEDVTFEGGFGNIQKGHAIAFSDLDRDGDQDICEVMGGAVEGDIFPNALYENPGGWNDNSWITLVLEGKTANRSAIGARIEVEVLQRDGGSRKIYRTIGTGGSFGAGSLQAEIGLGQAKQIRRITIKWPDAQHTTETYSNLDVNKYYYITEGQMPVELDWQPVPFRKRADMHM